MGLSEGGGDWVKGRWVKGRGVGLSEGGGDWVKGRGLIKGGGDRVI